MIWNCTFYFLEIGLPYDFMFPYVDYDYYIGFEEENNSTEVLLSFKKDASDVDLNPNKRHLKLKSEIKS